MSTQTFTRVVAIPKPEPSLWRIYSLILVVTLALSGVIVCATWIGFGVSTAHTALLDAVLECRYEVAMAHLAAEEALSGDKLSGRDDVLLRMESADRYARLMLEDAMRDSRSIAPFDAPGLGALTGGLREGLGMLRDIADERFAQPLGSGPTSKIDERFDSQFTAVIRQADEIEGILDAAIRRKLELFQLVQLALVAVCVSSAVLLSIVIRRYTRGREDKVRALARANEELAAANARLATTEQELRAGENELERQQETLKQTFLQIRESEENLRITIESIGDAVIVTDGEGRVVRMNPVAERLTGWAREDATGQKITEVIKIVDARDGRESENPVTTVLRQKRAMTLSEHAALLSRDGTRKPIGDSAAPMRSAEGEVTGVVLVFRDATVERSMHEVVSAERDRAEQYLDLAGTIIVALDRESLVTMVNRKGSEVLGRRKEEILGRNWFTLCVAPAMREAAQAGCRRVIEGGTDDSAYSEIAIVNKAGEERLVAWRCSTIRDRSGKVVGALGSGEDVTERRGLEEQVRHTEKLEAIGQLAGGVAHDFNNQLAGIMGSADMLRESLAQNRDLAELTDIIVASAQRASSLTNQLLAFSHRGKYQSIAVNVNDIIVDVATILTRAIDKRIQIRQRLAADPATVTGDPNQLQNAILNLGLNARDAMPEGGVIEISTETVYLDSWVCARSSYKLTPGSHVRICVTDTGVGMDAATKARVFEPFFTTKERGKGTGIGLSAVSGTVKQHGGSVEVTSEPGKGSTFTVLLPVCAKAEAVPAPSRRAPPVKGVSARILFVDDEKLVREMASTMLRRLGHKVVAATDGLEAVAEYKKSWKHIDLVILDMVIPEADGAETFAAIRAINPAARVLLSSGFSMDGAVQELLDKGAAGFLPKPYHAAQLAQSVNGALNLPV